MSSTSTDPARIITGVGTSLAILVALTLPFGYFLAAQRNLRTEVAGHAELLSRTVSRLVVEQPRGWKYLSDLDEKLRRELSHADLDQGGVAIVLEMDDAIIVRTGPAPPPPALGTEAPVFDAGVQVARVRVEHTMRPILQETAFAAALGLFLGMAIFIALRVFPLRALRRALDELRMAHNEAEDRAHELERQGRETEFLTQMTGVLQVVHSMDEAGQVIARTAEGLFPGGSGALYLFTESRTLLHAIVSWGELEAGGSFAPDECWAVRRAQAHLSQRGALEPMCAHGAKNADLQFCLPLSAQGEMLGILSLACAAGEVRLPAYQMLASRLADQLGLALGNLKLRESLKSMSIRDALTGLFNRRYLTETLDREFARAQRVSATVALIMLDVDHFKRFNDTFGHEAGDAVLRDLGVLLRQSVRADDIACRYGGEEFCLVLPQMGREGARQRAEAIRTGAAQLEIKSGGRTLGPVTLSLGIALFPEDGGDAQLLLRAADEAMYEAKRTGRDRVVVSSAKASQSYPA